MNQFGWPVTATCAAGHDSSPSHTVPWAMCRVGLSWFHTARNPLPPRSMTTRWSWPVAAWACTAATAGLHRVTRHRKES